MITVVLSLHEMERTPMLLYLFSTARRGITTTPRFGLALCLRGRSKCSDFWALKCWTVGARMLRMITGHVSQSIPDRSRYVNYDYSKPL
jgi:hypothetical protein